MSDQEGQIVKVLVHALFPCPTCGELVPHLTTAPVRCVDGPRDGEVEIRLGPPAQMPLARPCEKCVGKEQAEIKKAARTARQRKKFLSGKAGLRGGA